MKYFVLFDVKVTSPSMFNKTVERNAVVTSTEGFIESTEELRRVEKDIEALSPEGETWSDVFIKNISTLRYR